MGKLYSQYASGIQFTAGTIVGSELGTSGINPLVDRLNKSFPESFEYQWIDDSPAFNENVYTSENIFLNQNLSGCRIKGSFAASGAGSMVWELFKVSAGSVVNQTLLGSVAILGTLCGGITKDNSNNMISIDQDTGYIYTYDGISSVSTGSFTAGTKVGLAFDTSGGNLLSASRTTHHIYIHDGVSSTLLGSFSFSNPNDIAYDSTNYRLISVNTAGYIYLHSGISATLTGSFDSPAGPADFDSIAWDYDQENMITKPTIPPVTFIRVLSGASATILGSFSTGVSEGTTGGMDYWGAGSLASSDGVTDHAKIYDLGMEAETLESGLPYNDLYTADTAIDIGSFAKVRVKASRSISQNKLHSLTFDYL